MNAAWWRKWHRWIGFVAGVFLLFASITGVIVAMTEFFGEEEARREATRDLVSPVTTTSAPEAAIDALRRTLAAAAAQSPNMPIDAITIRFKEAGGAQTVEVALGRPTGGEDRREIYDARTGALLRTAEYTDKPFINRVHSGEAFGDGGLVIAMIWGTALAILSISGFVIYLTMRRRNAVGLRKIFW